MPERSNRLKILLVGYLPPPEEGTARITGLIRNSSFLNGQFDVLLLDLSKCAETEKRGKLNFANLLYSLRNYTVYFYRLIMFSPDIIHMPMAQNKYGFLRDSVFILIGRLFRKKIIAHFHGGNFDLFYEAQSSCYKAYIGYVLRKIDRLVLLAEIIKKQFNAYLERSKMMVLPNSIEIKECGSFGQIDKNGDLKKILFLGYISKAKGAVDLIKAVPYVNSGYDGRVEFVLCGRPIEIESNIVFMKNPNYGYSEILDYIKAKKIENEVKLLGAVEPREKWNLLSRADIFVLPSYSEGMPVSILEAMMCGLAIVTTPVGAVPEMLENGRNCLFAKIGDHEDLAEKILILLRDPEMRRRMGEENRKLANERFNASVFENIIEKLWRNA